MAQYIPDVYHGDRIESWEELKKNVRFLIFKATQGITFVSPKMAEYIQKCEEFGIPYWLYIFLNRGNELEQAKFGVRMSSGKVGKYFQGYCLDIESGNGTIGVRAALDYLKTISSKTMIYTYYADYPKYKDVITSRGSACAWWEARTKKVDDGLYTPALPCHPDVDLHQFTWKGTCPGIRNKCDLSRLTGNMAEVFFTGGKVKESTKPKSSGISANTILDIMRGWLGLSRKDGSHKPIIDLYNSYQPLARGYKVTLTDNYCATTVSAAFIKAGAVKLIGGTECSVERMIENCFKPAGIWNEDGSVRPEPGWIITYNWNDKTQPNDGWADHIGVVESVAKTLITVIEGNYGGDVKRRKIKIGDGNIRGYAIPKYTVFIQEDEKPELNKTVKKTGTVTATTLNVRTWAGTEYNKCSFSPLKQGDKVSICDTIKDGKGDDWYYIKHNGKYGFVSARYVNG